MLTFLSRLLHRSSAPRLRVVHGSASRSSGLRAQLRAVTDRDIRVAPVGATVFIAGQGARIYSLDAFRKAPGPHHPRAA